MRPTLGRSSDLANAPYPSRDARGKQRILQLRWRERELPCLPSPNP